MRMPVFPLKRIGKNREIASCDGELKFQCWKRFNLSDNKRNFRNSMKIGPQIFCFAANANNTSISKSKNSRDSRAVHQNRIDVSSNYLCRHPIITFDEEWNKSIGLYKYIGVLVAPFLIGKSESCFKCSIHSKSTMFQNICFLN